MQRSLESFEAERSRLERDNAALCKALHSLEVSLSAAPMQQATHDNPSMQCSSSPPYQRVRHMFLLARFAAERPLLSVPSHKPCPGRFLLVPSNTSCRGCLLLVPSNCACHAAAVLFAA
jgi:hypothetical protein